MLALNGVGMGFGIGLTCAWLVLTIVNMWLQPERSTPDRDDWRSWNHKIRIELALTTPIVIAITVILILSSM